MKRRCKRTVKSFARRYTTSTCRKSLFYKNRADSLSLSPNPFPLVKDCVCLVGSASCRARAYTPGIRAGAILLGLPPLVPVGGYAPKQGRFGCLPKVLHDAKPTKQATLDTPFQQTEAITRCFTSVRCCQG